MKYLKHFLTNKTSILLLSLVLILTTVAFMGTFFNSFVGDDEEFILTWQDTRNIQSIPKLLLGGVPYGHGGVYRPIRSLFYLAAYQLIQTQVFYYHLLAIAVHLLITTLVYFFTKKVSKKDSLAFFTSIIFGLHPIHTESIAFITASFDLWGAFFLFTSILFYLGYRERDKLRYYLLSLTFAYLSYFSNELAFALPFFILVLEITIFKSNIKKFRSLCKIILPYLAGVVSYFLARLILDIPKRGVILIDWYYTFLTVAKVFWYYITKTLFPINLNEGPTLFGDITAYDIRPDAVLSQKITDPTTLGAILAGLVICSLVLIYRKKDKLTTLSLSWLLLGLAPAMATFATGTLVQERYSYIASFGFCLFMGRIIDWLYKKKRAVAISALLIIVLFYSITTFKRTLDWRSSLSIISKTVSQSPRSARSNLVMGIIHTRREEYAKAESYLKKAIEIFPQYAEAYSALGNLYRYNNDFVAARENYDKAVFYNPLVPLHHFHLAQIEAVLGNSPRAEQILRKAVDIHPGSAELWYNFGAILFLETKFDEAEKAFLKTLSLDPNYESANNGLREVEKFKNQH